MPRFEHINEVIDSLCLRSGDLLMRNRGLYLDCVTDTWNDLNTDVLRLAERVKMPVRELFTINKRTNSVDLPCNFLKLSSVNVMDNCGILYPVFRNDKLHDDIVEIGSAKNCACEFKCGYRLCNTVKGYEVIKHTENDFLPNGDPISFNCVDRKSVDNQGFLYEQKQYPQRIYLSGVWTDTILHTETKKLCQVEVDTNGCICDTEHNINAVCDSCGISNNNNSQCCIGGSASVPPNDKCDTWTYYCSSKMDWFSVQCGKYPYFRQGCNNIYNISELGDRLIFPHNFGWDKVVVRFYIDIDLQDLYIPYMAKECFMTGLQYFASTHNDKKQQQAQTYGVKYSKQKWALFLELNKYRLEELRMIMTPPVNMPSFIQNRYRDDLL